MSTLTLKELGRLSFPLGVAFLYLGPWCTNNEKIFLCQAKYVGQSKLKHVDYYEQL